MCRLYALDLRGSAASMHGFGTRHYPTEPAARQTCPGNCVGRSTLLAFASFGELNRPSTHQRAGASKVALRRKPAGICNADVLPNCLWAAKSSSRRGSRIMTCWPSLTETLATAAADWEGAGAAANWAPEVAPPCNPAKELQPMAATAANDANPAAIFHRKTDEFAATAVSGIATCCTSGMASDRRPYRGSCASCSRSRITMD